jgi:hypothetical protein
VLKKLNVSKEKIVREDLSIILHGDISHISKVNERDVGLFNVEVVVYPRDVKNILRSYLDGSISAEDLINWAGFICIRGEYCSPNYLDDAKADYYEDMFYVIQRLSTPEIDGEISKSLVKSYLVELDKYSDDSA